MKKTIKFGTDGWRAVIADDFTFDAVRACSQGVADYVRQAGQGGKGVVIGYDTRFASEDFAAAAAEVLAGNGIRVFLSPRPVPTPVVSYGVFKQKRAGGIIITASHNPAAWNGFKYKSDLGTSASPEITSVIEKNIASILETGKIERMPLDKAMAKGLARYEDLESLYLEQVEKLVDLKSLKRMPLKVIIDPMYGAGAGYLKKILSGGELQIEEINGERNPAFPGIRPEPIQPNLKKLSEKVRSKKAAVGLATDGDADRMGAVDEKGEFITQLHVFALLCLYLLETRGQRGAIVKTVTASSMLYRLGEIYNVPVYETPVGFKYVAEVMLSRNGLIGGEESGGYGFQGHVTERDGILANLYFLDFMARTGKTPSQLIDYLFSKVGPHYYHRVDVEFDAKERQAILGRISKNEPSSLDGIKVATIDTVDGFRFKLADGAWLLMRFSGTEPLLRIYAESSSMDRVQGLLEEGKKLAGV